MNQGLFLLALRRTLAPAVIAVFLVLLVLLLAREGTGANARLDALLGGADPEGLSRGQARAGTWALLAIAFAPLLVGRAARAIPRWKAGEGEWLGSRAAGRGVALLSTWLGICAGCAAFFLVACLVIEARLGSSRPSLEPAGTIALPAPTWIGPYTPLAFDFDDAGARCPPGSRVRVEVGFASGSGSAAEVVFRARRAREGSERVAHARIASRGQVEVEVPEGSGALRFELACPGEGTRAYLVSDSAELWAPCSTDRAAGWRILAALVAVVAAWSALAIGLSAWVSVPTAALALLAAWLPAWLAEPPPAWIPGGDLWTALAVAGGGRVPAASDPRSFLVAAGLVAVGLGIGAAGLWRWREP